MKAASLMIEAIEVIRFNIPLTEPFVISNDSIAVADNVLVRIITRSGLEGQGECSPFPTILGETQDSCFAVAQKIAGRLIGQNALSMESCSRIIQTTIAGNACIKSAFDMALWDIAGKHADLPLYVLLGGKLDKPLHTDMTIGIQTPEKMAAAAEKYKAQGFPYIKVKLGTQPSQDLTRMEAIREATGPDFPLRIDANQGWSLADAKTALHLLAKHNIAYCEEPVSKQYLLDLPKLRRESPIPLMADESLFDAFDALRLIRLEAVDFFNIKLAKSGGIYGALKIAAVAEAAGVSCQVGCFSESRLGLTALAHLALSRQVITHYDMDSALMHAGDPVIGGIVYGPNGTIELPDAPGLGAHIDPLFLQEGEGKVITGSSKYP
jgi:L-Ala-D/L-Glu epimerase